MRFLGKTTAAATLLMACSTVYANDMYLDLGSNAFDASIFVGTEDLDSTTGTFTEFGFSQILATSIYDPTLALGTTVIDTNDPALLGGFGIPAAGIAMDGSTPVSLVMPDCLTGQCDIDALSPLVPPLGSDNEGFLGSWDLQVEYYFEATLTPVGPKYTSGYIDIYLNDFTIPGLLDEKVLHADLTKSNLTLANLDLFFDITMAKDDFLWLDDGKGGYVDANDGTISGNYATMALDTNVNPPIPSLNQLLLVGGKAIRQSTLDGSITASVPEPGTIAMLGMGLLGLGAAGYRRRRARS